MRAAAFYLLATVTIAFFGGEVCPFVAEMGLWHWAAVLVPHFGIGFLLRAWIVPRLVRRCDPLKQPARQFWLEFAWFAGIALAITATNSLGYAYPLGSGLVVMVGILTIGLFAAIDLALERERVLARELSESKHIDVQADSFAPFSSQMMVFAVGCILIVALDLILVLGGDLRWLATLEPGEIEGAGRVVFLEVGAIFAVLLGLVLNLVISFSRNLRLHLHNQTEALQQVSDGRLDGHVPVFTRNEFGMIASHTNEMIDGLRERDRVKDVFGKVVSPQVAARMLREQEGGVKLGGSRHHVAVLMSDIRSFTERTEGSDPEAVVNDLNRYFSEMVAIVHEEGGIVDKFIGDGLLCVFGLDAPNRAETAALDTAQRMIERVEILNYELEVPIRIGIGIHSGEVIAGNIGSLDRLEFTVIGDAVNTAARLETLSKKLKTSIVVSARVRQKLPEAESAGWRSFGPQALKGKQEEIEVFGPS